jgi:hypothetical protein
MPPWIGILIGLGALALAGCATSDDREWMKIDRERYSKEELRRDYKDCSKKGDVDEPCMRQRGWVPMSPTKEEAPKSMDPLGQKGQSRGRY